MDENYVKAFMRSLTPDQIAEGNRRGHEEHTRQVAEFSSAYKQGICYLCGEAFDQMRASEPCTHWLLRRCRFRKKDFSKIYTRYDYHNIAAFLRWCANEEAYARNINDLAEERAERKVISYTIKWKNIEWTFDCAENDLKGHGVGHSLFPHYHFQMRIDGRQFINFNEFHIPFSDRDKFNISLRHEPYIRQDFGSAGSGMQDAMDVDLEKILEHTLPTDDENDGLYHISTIAEFDPPISGEELHEIFEEAKLTRRTISVVMRERAQDRAKMTTIVSPIENIPDIAHRTEHKPR